PPHGRPGRRRRGGRDRGRRPRARGRRLGDRADGAGRGGRLRARAGARTGGAFRGAPPHGRGGALHRRLRPVRGRMSPSAPRRARVAQALLLGALAAACTALAPLHGGPWWAGFPAPARGWLALAVIAAYVVACAGILWRARARAARAAAAPARDEWLVVHASQTGQAVELATRTVEALRAAGLRARARDIATLDTAALVAARQALFVASTTGEGDAPDAAAAFLAGPMRAGAALPGLRYAVLALGDRSYRHYCAFGRALDDWLRRAGATPMFDLVDVDNGDPAALRHWQHHLGVATGAPALPDWRPAAYGAWTLAARRELNPGSAGGPGFDLRLRPPPGVRADWRAGDIAEVGPRQPPAAVEAFLAASGLAPDAPVSSGHGWIALRDLLSRSQLPDPAATRGQDAAAFAAALQPLPHREYSIASVPGEGHVRLLLRRLLRPDGSPGIGSGWLCDHAPAGGVIDLRIRANPGFHGPSPETPLVLVGNGTGIAGLRAHVAERVAAG